MQLAVLSSSLIPDLSIPDQSTLPQPFATQIGSGIVESLTEDRNHPVDLCVRDDQRRRHHTHVDDRADDQAEFEAMLVDARFSGGDTLAADFEMTALAVSLDTVSVQGITRQHGKFLEFKDRRTHGAGAYLTRADLEKENDRQLGEIVAKLPGVRINRYGSEIAVASSRLTGGLGGDAMDRRKGAPRSCYSQVYVDNVRVFSSGVGEALFNINTIPPATIEGVEYYPSRAETPIQYATSRAECGTLLIWTRIE